MMDAHFRLLAVTFLIGLSLLLVGCSQQTTPEADNRLHITVSIVPQRYFVQRLGGEHVVVNVMVEPGANPATYEPKPAQLRVLSQADAYVSIGVPFEQVWLARIRAANPNMMLIDTTQGIERMPMGGGTENLDPHIWLSPRLVKIQAQTIYEGLVELDPANAADYQANLDQFLADIDRLEISIQTSMADLQIRKFMVFHPAWGYFARDCGLEMIPIEVGGQKPSATELAALISKAKEENISVVFAQPELSTRAAETIAKEINGRLLLIDPLAADWLENLSRVADTFAEVLG